ncbi:MAG: ketoacyl-ACP synthase III [Bacteriovoracaceae bacterium]|jgi:3-oxoacyl-[acyl-carrier-protein] synthase III|nr:ketoacyl-ACP synthase III [Bacteriovoracaceae bacterium]
MTQFRTKILAMGSNHPEKKLTNFDLEKMVDTNHEWIVERTGISERRISDRRKGELPSDMAAKATRQALDKANLNADEIDLIIYATNTPDNNLPNSAVQLQQKLGITNQCPAFDLTAACSGFVYGMSMADNLIKAGAYKKILVVGTEMLSNMVNWSDRSTCILFGDGAGVAVVGRASEGESSEILATKLGSDGSGKESLWIPNGGCAKPITEENVNDPDRYIQMVGQDIFKWAVRTLAKCAKTVLEDAGKTLADVDWFIPHQANMRIIQAAAKRLDIPQEKVIINIERFGNTSAATIPTAMDEAIEDGRIRRGDLILIDAFGAGLTYGASLLVY